MKHALICLGIAAGLLGPTMSAHAVKTVYRCIDGGRVIYADEPCPAGTGRAVVVDDSKSVVTRREANDVTRLAAPATNAKPKAKANKPRSERKSKPVAKSESRTAKSRPGTNDASMKKVENLMDAASATIRAKP